MKHLTNLTLTLFFFGILSSCSEKKEAQENSITEEVICNGEHISADSSTFIANKKFHTTNFLNGKTVSREKAKNGISSVKLFGKAEYGMTYIIDEVETADVFELEVWKFSSAKNGLLVVSANNSDIYYQQSDKVVEKDEKGWEKITMEVIAPVALNGKSLKVYVWNQDKINSVYFDDLKITYVGKKK